MVKKKLSRKQLEQQHKAALDLLFAIAWAIKFRSLNVEKAEEEFTEFFKKYHLGGY